MKKTNMASQLTLADLNNAAEAAKKEERDAAWKNMTPAEREEALANALLDECRCEGYVHLECDVKSHKQGGSHYPIFTTTMKIEYFIGKKAFEAEVELGISWSSIILKMLQEEMYAAGRINQDLYYAFWNTVGKNDSNFYVVVEGFNETFKNTKLPIIWKSWKSGKVTVGPDWDHYKSLFPNK